MYQHLNIFETQNIDFPRLAAHSSPVLRQSEPTHLVGIIGAVVDEATLPHLGLLNTYIILISN